LPYAGFFEEKLKRDTKIKQNNQKNSINDYSDFCKKKDITILNVIKNDHYQFNGNNLQNLGLIQEDYTKDLEPKKYLEFYKNQYSKINLPYIRDYFLKSGFQNNLHLYILLTDDKFKFNFMGFFINFENKKTIFKVIKNFDRKKLLVNKNIKKLVLKVRKESFLNTVYNKLPWEDLSIGFQCKVLRYPNIYNVDFWNYFTNEYTTSKNVRAVIKCSFCSKVTQFFDNNIYA
jgi:CMP-N-acetylneuraminate monooxygenase